MTDPLLLLHRRHRRRGAHRHDRDAARRNPHAGLHAGRHRGDGQGDEARDVRATGRRHHPRQHLSPDAAARRGAGRAARRAAPVHGLGPADPDRQRRLPGDEPVRADQAQRGGGALPEPPRRVDAHAQPRAVDGDPAAARLGHRHGVRRMPAAARRPRSRPRRRWSGRCAGRSARATRSTRAASMPRARRCSASSRARWTRSCARRRPRR